MADKQMERILIVDDEKTNIDVLVGLLSESYTTVVAKNGEQALKRATAKTPPDLILLDVMMPGMNGYEVCRRLKATPATEGIPVIFITSAHTAQDETMALKSGAVDFIRKPFNPNVVLARIETHLILKRQQNRLVELNQLKNTFLGMAAHDLRNPLNAITGLSDMLMTMSLTPSEAREFISTINRASTQMFSMINDLLDVSVIESGAFGIAPKPGDLTALVKERLDMMRVTADEKRITLDSHLEPTPQIPFDHERFRQVVDNLLSNAVKFSPPGTTITVTTRPVGDDGLTVSVADQGPGIPEENRAEIFKAFTTSGAMPTGGERSTGLGLSIVKRILDAHNATITVDPSTASGTGTRFTVTLTASNLEDTVNEETLKRSIQEGDGDEDYVDEEPKRILLVDDDYALRLMYRKAFSEYGFIVVGEAENGEEGVKQFQELSPDIVLLDIEMPVMDGITALKSIMRSNPDACVIMLTSINHSQVWDDCLTAGASHYITKDTAYSMIHKRVEEVWAAHT
ncbi:MAG: response regulator [Magnetococcales bacterium]|nr:response regulator [Magnetococcales bacterium]